MWLSTVTHSFGSGLLFARRRERRKQREEKMFQAAAMARRFAKDSRSLALPPMARRFAKDPRNLALPPMGLCSRHGYGSLVPVTRFHRRRTPENGEITPWYKLLKQLGERRIYRAVKKSCLGNPDYARRLTKFMELSETVRYQLKFYCETETPTVVQIEYLSLDHACRDFAKAYTPGIFASVLAFLGGVVTVGNFLYQNNQLERKLRAIRSEVRRVSDLLEARSEMWSDLETRFVEEKEISENRTRKLVAGVKDDLMKEVALVLLEVKKK